MCVDFEIPIRIHLEKLSKQLSITSWDSMEGSVLEMQNWNLSGYG